jgi:hypothetical protein
MTGKRRNFNYSRNSRRQDKRLFSSRSSHPRVDCKSALLVYHIKDT